MEGISSTVRHQILCCCLLFSPLLLRFTPVPSILTVFLWLLGIKLHHSIMLFWYVQMFVTSCINNLLLLFHFLIQDLSNTFQVWLGSDNKASFALFLYGDILWGENAQIGFNAGDNDRSFSIPESLTDDTVNIEHRSNINETSAFLFRVDS